MHAARASTRAARLDASLDQLHVRPVTADQLPGGLGFPDVDAVRACGRERSSPICSSDTSIPAAARSPGGVRAVHLSGAIACRHVGCGSTSVRQRGQHPRARVGGFRPPEHAVGVGKRSPGRPDRSTRLRPVRHGELLEAAVRVLRPFRGQIESRPPPPVVVPLVPVRAALHRFFQVPVDPQPPSRSHPVVQCLPRAGPRGSRCARRSCSRTVQSCSFRVVSTRPGPSPVLPTIGRSAFHASAAAFHHASAA